MCRRHTKQLSWLQALLCKWGLENTPVTKTAREITNRIVVLFLNKDAIQDAEQSSQGGARLLSYLIPKTIGS